MRAIPRSAMRLVAAGLAWVCAGCGLPMTGLVSPGAGHDVRIAAADRTLRWEEFPRERDAKVFGPDYRTRISNVRYELMVERHTHDSHTEPMFVRGLTRPEWRVPEDIEAGVPYGWAARARFDLDGRPRVTQWTTAGYGPTTAVGAWIPYFRIEPDAPAK